MLLAVGPVLSPPPVWLPNQERDLGLRACPQDEDEDEEDGVARSRASAEVACEPLIRTGDPRDARVGSKAAAWRRKT